MINEHGDRTKASKIDRRVEMSCSLCTSLSSSGEFSVSLLFPIARPWLFASSYRVFLRPAQAINLGLEAAQVHKRNMIASGQVWLCTPVVTSLLIHLGSLVLKQANAVCRQHSHPNTLYNLWHLSRTCYNTNCYTERRSNYAAGYLLYTTLSSCINHRPHAHLNIKYLLPSTYPLDATSCMSVCDESINICARVLVGTIILTCMLLFLVTW